MFLGESISWNIGYTANTHPLQLWQHHRAIRLDCLSSVTSEPGEPRTLQGRVSRAVSMSLRFAFDCAEPPRV